MITKKRIDIIVAWFCFIIVIIYAGYKQLEQTKTIEVQKQQLLQQKQQIDNITDRMDKITNR